MGKTRDMANIVNVPSGVVTKIASGNIASAGLSVALNSDGTVSAIKTLPDTVGATTQVGTNAYLLSACYNVAAGKVVVAYTDTANSYKGVYVVGTVTGTSITFGTPGFFTGAAAYEVAVSTVDGTTGVVFAYKNGSNNGVVAAGNISGTTITVGTAAVYAANASAMKLAEMPGTTSVIVGYVDNYGQANAIAANVSGTSIAVGAATVLSGSSAAVGEVINLTANYTEGKVVVAFRANSSNTYAVVLSATGTTITAGSTTLVAAHAAYYMALCDITGTSNVLIAYKNGASGGITSCIATISGYTLTFGAQVAVVATDSTYPACVYDSQSGVAVVSYKNSSIQPSFVRGVVTGTSISYGAASVFASGTCTMVRSCYDSAQGETVSVSINSTTSAAQAAVIQSLRTTKNKRVGISVSPASDGAAVNITTLGGINSNQSGLTPGATYYVGDDGSLTSVGGANPRIGRALSATALLVTDSV